MANKWLARVKKRDREMFERINTLKQSSNNLPVKNFFSNIYQYSPAILENYFLLCGSLKINSEHYRNGRSQMFLKIGVVKNFVIFIGKHLYWSLILIKLLA